MKESDKKKNPRPPSGKGRAGKNRMIKPEEGAMAEGGFMLTTSEILDFAEGTDSTP